MNVTSAGVPWKVETRDGSATRVGPLLMTLVGLNHLPAHPSTMISSRDPENSKAARQRQVGLAGRLDVEIACR